MIYLEWFCWRVWSLFRDFLYSNIACRCPTNGFSTICLKDYHFSIELPFLLCQRWVDYMDLFLGCLCCWRGEWQSTPVFLPGESHGLRSLVGYSPWGYKESDTTDGLTLLYFVPLIYLSILSWLSHCHDYCALKLSGISSSVLFFSFNI